MALKLYERLFWCFSQNNHVKRGIVNVYTNGNMFHSVGSIHRVILRIPISKSASMVLVDCATLALARRVRVFPAPETVTLQPESETPGNVASRIKRNNASSKQASAAANARAPSRDPVVVSKALTETKDNVTATKISTAPIIKTLIKAAAPW